VHDVAGYQKMVARGFLVHSHMLRHGCGFKLATDGQDTRAIQAYLGHRSIQSTERYTALAPDRFKNIPGISKASSPNAQIRGPLSGAKRKTYAHCEFFRF